MKVLIYSYYSRPWRLQSGDDARIHAIAKALKGHIKSIIVVYNLNHLVNKITIFKDDVVYVNIPRKFYRLIARLLRWKQQHDLNFLMKLTHYIDEFTITIKLANIIRRTKIL